MRGKEAIQQIAYSLTFHIKQFSLQRVVQCRNLLKHLQLPKQWFPKFGSRPKQGSRKVKK